MASVDSRIVSQFLNVSVSNISDALDRLGIEGQPSGILPVNPTHRIAGPAVVEQADSTIVIPPSFQATVDPHGRLIMTRRRTR